MKFKRTVKIVDGKEQAVYLIPSAQFWRMVNCIKQLKKRGTRYKQMHSALKSYYTKKRELKRLNKK